MSSFGHWLGVARNSAFVIGEAWSFGWLCTGRTAVGELSDGRLPGCVGNGRGRNQHVAEHVVSPLLRPSKFIHLLSIGGAPRS